MNSSTLKMVYLVPLNQKTESKEFFAKEQGEHQVLIHQYTVE